MLHNNYLLSPPILEDPIRTAPTPCPGRASPCDRFLRFLRSTSYPAGLRCTFIFIEETKFKRRKTGENKANVVVHTYVQHEGGEGAR